MKKVFRNLLVVALVFTVGFILTGCEKEIGESLKIDKTKELVYDAEYTSNVKAESYVTHFDETYYSKDIIVPYININSEYATKSNNEIKNVFESAINAYNEGVDTGLVYIDECNYEKYESDKELSVLLTLGIGGTDVVDPEYYTYNINLDNGNELSYEDIYTLVGFTKDNIDEKVNTAISNELKEYLNGDDIDISTYKDESINNYKESVTNNTLKYFLEDNKLNIVVKLSVPVGKGSYNRIVELN